MELLAAASLLCGAAMVVTHLALLVGALRAAALESAVPDRYEGSLSIVVPARNEAANLPALLTCLQAQTRRGAQIVFVDDGSTDGTPAVLEAFRVAHPERVVVIRLEDEDRSTDGPRKRMNPKQRALAAGIDLVTGDVIVLTDADCTMGPEWLAELSRPFAADRVGLVFGPAAPSFSGGALFRFQAFDHVFRFFYTMGIAGLGAASGGFGNNLAVRRRDLEALGGYRNLRYSPTEDAELIARVRSLAGREVMALVKGAVEVRTGAQSGLAAWIGQSKRWNAGGLFAPDLMTRIGYGWLMLGLLFGVVLLPFGLSWPLLAAAGLLTGGSMVVFAIVAGLRFRRDSCFLMLVPMLVVSAMLLYSFVTVLTLLGIGIRWKGRKL